MKSVRQLVFPVFFLGLIIGVFVILHLTKVITVKHISCQIDQGQACPDYIAAELDSLLGKSLFFTDFTHEGSTILQHASFLSQVRITKKLPDSIAFSFSSLPAVYVIKDAADLSWQVDQAGFMTSVASASAHQLPLVQLSASYPLRPATGEKLNPEEHQNILLTLDNLKTVTQSYQLHFISPTQAQLVLADRKKVVFDPRHAPEQLSKLSYLLDHFSFQSVKQPIAEVDLRFSQIILRTASASATITAQ